jgi:hypothetical protein
MTEEGGCRKLASGRGGDTRLRPVRVLVTPNRVVTDAGLLVREKRGRWRWRLGEPSRLASVWDCPRRVSPGRPVGRPSNLRVDGAASGGNPDESNGDTDGPGDEQSAHYAPSRYEEKDERPC